MTGKGKRRFKDLQRLILRTLAKSTKTINEISESAKINWNSTSRQLILLKGHELVREIFSHKRLRVFEITDKGRRVLKRE
jgi:predicted transcriptional regulator